MENILLAYFREKVKDKNKAGSCMKSGPFIKQ
jgi:hypothetical protein